MDKSKLGKGSEGRPLEDWLPEIVSLLQTACNPLQIILFGSLARHDESPDSDIDVLVIIDDDTDQKAAAISALKSVVFVTPEVDVITLPKRVVEEKKNTIGNVIRQAMQEGRVLYQRAA